MGYFVLGFLICLLIVIVFCGIYAWVDGVNEDLEFLKNERHTQIECNKITEDMIKELYKKLDEEKKDE